MNAREWLARETSPEEGICDLAVVGAPISRASITPSDAWATPPAFRKALERFPTWDAAHGLDLETLRAIDLGDVGSDRDESDAVAAHARVQSAVRAAFDRALVVVVVGGDNSLTCPALLGAMRAHPEASWGLLTVDAHHDLRPVDGHASNGTPVRQLLEAGLPGRRIAQVGIHPWGNAAEHAAFATQHGIHVHPVSDVHLRGGVAAAGDALVQLDDNGVDAIYADLDLDVVDRASAPACPASMPGGMAPLDLLAIATRLGAHRRVTALDLCEVDANRDVNGMTLRLMAQAFLSFCSGVLQRRRSLEA